MNYIFAGLVLAFAAQPNAVSHNERQSRIEFSLETDSELSGAGVIFPENVSGFDETVSQPYPNTCKDNVTHGYRQSTLLISAYDNDRDKFRVFFSIQERRSGNEDAEKTCPHEKAVEPYFSYSRTFSLPVGDRKEFDAGNGVVIKLYRPSRYSGSSGYARH